MYHHLCPAGNQTPLLYYNLVRGGLKATDINTKRLFTMYGGFTLSPSSYTQKEEGGLGLVSNRDTIPDETTTIQASEPGK